MHVLEGSQGAFAAAPLKGNAITQSYLDPLAKRAALQKLLSLLPTAAGDGSMLGSLTNDNQAKHLFLHVLEARRQDLQLAQLLVLACHGFPDFPDLGIGLGGCLLQHLLLTAQDTQLKAQAQSSERSSRTGVQGVIVVKMACLTSCVLASTFEAAYSSTRFALLKHSVWFSQNSWYFHQAPYC